MGPLSRLLCLAYTIYTIESGKLAELMLARGNPAEDIRCLIKIKAVIQSGKLVEPPLLDFTRN